MTTTTFSETAHPRSADGTFTVKSLDDADVELCPAPESVMVDLQPGDSRWGWPAVEEKTGLDAVEVSRSAETGRYEVRGERYFRYTELVPETITGARERQEWARRFEPVIDETITDRYRGVQLDSRCGEAVAAFHCDFDEAPDEHVVATALKAGAAPALSQALRAGTDESRALLRGIAEKVSATAMVDDAQASRRAAKAIRDSGMVDAEVDGEVADAHAMAVAAHTCSSVHANEYPQLRRFASRGLGNRAAMAAEIEKAQLRAISARAATTMLTWLSQNDPARRR